MKPQHLKLFTAFTSAVLSFVVKDYSSFLAGIMLGAAIVIFATTAFQLLNKKNV